MEEKISIDYNSRISEGIVDELFHPIHRMYTVKFDDGYENIFFTDVESGRWLEQDLGFTSLAESVGEKIKYLFPGSVKTKRDLQWYTSEEDEWAEPVYFGFYHYKLGAFPVFEIYAPNRRFLFSMILVNKDFWQVFKIEDDWDYNNSEKLMNALPEILEIYIDDSTLND